MSKFYVRVFQDGVRYRTVGHVSKTENDKFFDYFKDAKYQSVVRDSKNDSGCAHAYRLEFIRNRNGTKVMYREVEFLALLADGVLPARICGGIDYCHIWNMNDYEYAMKHRAITSFIHNPDLFCRGVTVICNI